MATATGLRQPPGPSGPGRKVQWEAPSGEQAEFSLLGSRAVVVEDEGITQLQIRSILRNKGVEVVGVASNGADAIDVVRRTRPDFVLMDVRMPKMNGLEATKRILEDVQVCIIMLTAFSEESLRDEAAEAGASGCIMKPITSGTLIPQLRAILGSRRPDQ